MSIIGSWSKTDAASSATTIYIFTSSNEYFSAHYQPVTGKLSFSGIEWGTYDWNSTSEMVDLSVSVDTNGQAGLLDPRATNNPIVYISPNTDAITVVVSGDSTTSDVLASTRSSQSEIYGSWYGKETVNGETVTSVFTLLDTGYFSLVMVGPPVGDLDATPGAEWGTYRWDESAGQLSVSLLYDGNGLDWGFSAGQGVGTMTLSNGVLTVDESNKTHSMSAIAPAGSATEEPEDPSVGTDDEVFGGDGDNAIATGGGNDRVFGEGGDDWIDAGYGDDYLDGGDGSDYLFGNIGRDTLIGGAGDDQLEGGADDDFLDGGLGEDILDGGAGDDILDGGEGADRMSGGDGNDIYYVDDSGDLVIETPNTISSASVAGFRLQFASVETNIDKVFASIDYTLTQYVENLELTDEALLGTGNDLDNELIGNALNNLLVGEGGDDFIDGAEGLDFSIYERPAENYQVTAEDGVITVVDIDTLEGVDTLVNVERLSFLDVSLAMDFQQGEAAYNSATLIGTAFGAEYLETFFAIGLSLFDEGSSINEVASLIVDAGLIEGLFQADTHRQWVEHIYANVVGTGPSQSESDYYTGLLNNGLSKVSLLELAHGVSLVEQQIQLPELQAGGFEYTPFG